MSVLERDLGDEGLEYLRDYLGIEMPLAGLALDRVLSTAGTATAFLPEQATPDVACEFSSARALHPPFTNVPLEQWAITLRSPSRSVGPEARRLTADLVAESLAGENPSCLACINDVGFWGAPMPDTATEAGIDKYPVVFMPGPASLKSVGNLLRAAYMMRTLIVLVLTGTCTECFTETEESIEVDSGLSDRISMIVVEAYDGEGYVLWHAPGV